MAIYLVNQGKTYKYERAGGYIWSPKLNSAGHQNKGYSLMKSVRKGDYIIHNSGARLSAISIVQQDCQSGKQPNELKTGQDEYDWNDDGWIIYTDYYDFDVPLLTADLTTWAIENYREDSAFQVNGRLRLQYLCNLQKVHAEYLIRKALGFEKNSDVIDVLRAALAKVNPAAAVTPITTEEKPVEKPAPVIEPKPDKPIFDANSVKVQSTVSHNRFGKGIVTLIEDGKIYVNFGGQQRIFQYPDAFEKGWLKL